MKRRKVVLVVGTALLAAIASTFGVGTAVAGGSHPVPYGHTWP